MLLERLKSGGRTLFESATRVLECDTLNQRIVILSEAKNLAFAFDFEVMQSSLCKEAMSYYPKFKIQGEILLRLKAHQNDRRRFFSPTARSAEEREVVR